ncbi:MAG: FtsQ-type POTRA domain-containing protein [Deltaproteobacteria bacterium]|nr:FtsQ-type POTRA domain-containing protein [Deltaproteobacteria bacterium]
MRKKRPINRRRRESLASRVRRRMTVILKVSCVVASLPAVLFGCWYFYQFLLASPLLGIKHADVVGVKRVSTEEVIALSGIVMGDNLLAVDAGEVIEKIKKEPWIEGVRVRRRLPDRVVIEVVEREAAAIINMDALYIVDSKGTVFKRYTGDDGLDLPIITGFQSDEIDEGESPLSHIFSLMELLSEERVFTLADVSEITLDERYGVELYTMREVVKIELGWDDFREKIDRLEKIISLRRGKLEGIEQIDMTGPGGVVVKMSKKRDVQV